MRKLRRRIEILEKNSQTVQDQRKGITERVLRRLGPIDAESLLSAFGAEQAGRNLSETEETAKQAYLKAFLEECPASGPYAGTDLANTLDPHHLVIMVLSRMSLSEVYLVRSALPPARAGRSATEEESAALQACNNEYLRLRRLAGGRPCPPEAQE
ncbi:MAG TPA: hypothetical protein VG096_13655 [Bryobacteraceae bacterium]|jgi:hypothetical protein|nr:hypothetical protein [Bryobacteraceae bacterium]